MKKFQQVCTNSLYFMDVRAFNRYILVITIDERVRYPLTKSLNDVEIHKVYFISICWYTTVLHHVTDKNLKYIKSLRK